LENITGPYNPYEKKKETTIRKGSTWLDHQLLPLNSEEEKEKGGKISSK